MATIHMGALCAHSPQVGEQSRLDHAFSHRPKGPKCPKGAAELLTTPVRSPSTAEGCKPQLCPATSRRRLVPRLPRQAKADQAKAEREREDKEEAKRHLERPEKRERLHKQPQIMESLLSTVCDKEGGGALAGAAATLLQLQLVSQ